MALSCSDDQYFMNVLDGECLAKKAYRIGEQVFEKENIVYWRTWKSLPNATYLDSVVHGVRYDNVPLAGHGYTTGKLEMTVSTSGRAKQEAEVAVHAKNLPYKHRTNIPEQLLTMNL